jgi:YHS domain-containing protein
LEKNQMVPGERRFGGYYDNRLYLFSSEETARKFDSDPTRYAAAAARQSAVPNGNPQR